MFMKIWSFGKRTYSKVPNFPLKHFTFKAIYVVPSLLLQKLSKASKLKDHVRASGRRINL